MGKSVTVSGIEAMKSAMATGGTEEIVVRATREVVQKVLDMNNAGQLKSTVLSDAAKRALSSVKNAKSHSWPAVAMFGIAAVTTLGVVVVFSRYKMKIKWKVTRYAEGEVTLEPISSPSKPV